MSNGRTDDERLARPKDTPSVQLVRISQQNRYLAQPHPCNSIDGFP